LKMALGEFNAFGDLPPGIHKTSLSEVMERFGRGSDQRRKVAKRFRRVLEIAKATGKLRRCVIFGSFVTNKPEPNDVDLILVMDVAFLLSSCTVEQLPLFDHLQAQSLFGASVFWICPTGLLFETEEDFLSHWQVKRDGTRRGIVEIDLEVSSNDSER
jgi:predicted nucleotidyltransferase